MREFIVEADGGSRGNPGPAGYGAVVSDAATGETLREVAEYIGVATNNVAEYRGLLAGLRAAHALDPAAAVHVRMDSKLVVEQMSGRWKIKHPDMKPLAAQAARVFPPGRVTYEWIPRERNKHADRLANEAMDAGARGERWSETESTAELDTAGEAGAAGTAGTSGGAGGAGAYGSAAGVVPSEPPGDAVAGAARVRGALAEGRAAAAAADSGPDAARASTAPGRDVPAGTASGSATDDADARAVRAVGDARAPQSDGDSDTRGVRAAEGARAPQVDADVLAPQAEGDGDSDGGTRAAGAHTDARAAKAGADDSRATKTGADARTAKAAADARATKAGADTRAAKAVAAPGWAPADMGAPATFVLLRHGETPLTPQKRFSGSGGTDPSLSDTGREQAERAAAMLARRGTIQAVVSSPLARTRETAGIVAARLGLDVSIDDGLRETDFGAWEGLTFAEVRERHPDDLNAWLASPDAEPTGGGESFAATATRLAATRDKLVAAHAGRTVLLVTHVTPIKTLVRLALGAPPESLFRMELSAASLSVVAYYADGNASVRLFNDTSHLR
ncbi:bifunctional RNase H/acid phosphatase [Streptomyces luteogriseus]|uniref:bifunctional RNase H/acid phosphatase n=1 Tax=Streptomyces luteogriseus TaxID=68233 RepID=UPI002E32BAFA|nr:bifunctional RNase H/acid phosphatase [Streptomyces luteogriseus]WTJ30860.1 bifunctional RNase H/acid phosphatase [Streptomyces luteogriseus]